MIVIFSNLLKGLPSLFFMNKDDAVTLLRSGDPFFVAYQDGLYIKRRFIRTYVNETRTRQGGMGGMIVSEFMEKMIENFVESSENYRLCGKKEIHSPYEYISLIHSTLITVREKAKLLFIESSSEGCLNLKVVEGPTMPDIKADRLTISSEDSVWNHFKMCATIAASGESQVVNMITTETSVEIHATNDHEEYLATIPLTGGEPVTRQAIAIPVSLINEVSYWMETGLHTESHLDIWFDENHVKFGTRANQVLAKIEEYQPRKFDWEASPEVVPYVLSEKDVYRLSDALMEATFYTEDLGSHFSPVLDLSCRFNKFEVEYNDYVTGRSVSVGIPELLDFKEFVFGNDQATEINVEVNPRENHVVFHGGTHDDQKQVTSFRYVILGVICGASANSHEEEGCLNLPGHSRSELLTSYEEEDIHCKWTTPCQENFEGTPFTERLPLDIARRSLDQELFRKSMEDHECPTMVLRREADLIIRELQDTYHSVKKRKKLLMETTEDSFITCNIESSFSEEEWLDLPYVKPYRSLFEDMSFLKDGINYIEKALEQETKMFDPEGTHKAIALLEQAIHDAKWIYFRFKNKHEWGNKPHLWQQQWQ